MEHMRIQIAYLDDQLIKAKAVIRAYQENPQQPPHNNNNHSIEPFFPITQNN
jgi:hypothetical protein